jgi:class 3 adenylate cyclase
VNLNDRLDYFGTSVNLAARVESLSDGGQILVSRATAERANAANLLGELGWVASEIEARPKGFPQPVPVLRFTRSAPR